MTAVKPPGTRGLFSSHPDSPQSSSRAMWLAASALLAFSMASGVSRAAAQEGFLTVGAGESFVVAIEAEPGVAGWDITLRIGNPRADLDLYVYADDPRTTGFPDELCSSASLETTEVCRVLFEESIWVEVYNLDDRLSSIYELNVIPLRGPTIAGTNLVADDARPLRLGTALHDSLGSTTARLKRLYEVSLDTARPDRLFINLFAHSAGTTPSLSVFDDGGSPVAASRAGDTYQELDVSAEGMTRVFVLVGLEGRTRQPVEFDLVVEGEMTALPVDLQKGYFEAGGAESREYSVELAGGQLILATFYAEGPELSIVSEDGADIPVISRSRRVQSALIGDGFMNSDVVLAPLSRPVDYRVGVEGVASEDPFASPEWRLVLSDVGADPRFESYAVRFDPSQATRLEGSWLDRVESGSVSAGAVRAYQLDRPLSAREPSDAPQGPREAAIRRFATQLQRGVTPSPLGVFRAELRGPEAARLNLAICTSLGQVLDIGSRSVTWDWPPMSELVDRLDTSLYLVVFPAVSGDQRGGAFELGFASSGEF